MTTVQNLGRFSTLNTYSKFDWKSVTDWLGQPHTPSKAEHHYTPNVKKTVWVKYKLLNDKSE